MSTVDRPKYRVLPPLEAGQRLDQPTFHERYAAMPAGKWFELIGGVVHMAFPLYEGHGVGDSILTWWLVQYWRYTPGVRNVSNVTTILEGETEVQPDTQLRLLESAGGRARVEGGCIVGPPELVVEVGLSSRPHDLNAKKAAYEAGGVLEYLFLGIEPKEVRWFVRREGRFEEMPAGEDGIYRSEVFPGLWLDPKALFSEDLNGLIAALERGLATPEHARFVEELTARMGGR